MVVVRRLIVLLMLRPTWFGFVVVGVVMEEYSGFPRGGPLVNNIHGRINHDSIQPRNPQPQHATNILTRTQHRQRQQAEDPNRRHHTTMASIRKKSVCSACHVSSRCTTTPSPSTIATANSRNMVCWIRHHWVGATFWRERMEILDSSVGSLTFAPLQSL